MSDLEGPAPAQGTSKGGSKRGYSWRATHCPYCWRPLTTASGADQHQYRSLNCLTWQRYLRGGVTWWETECETHEEKLRRERLLTDP